MVLDKAYDILNLFFAIDHWIRRIEGGQQRIGANIPIVPLDAVVYVGLRLAIAAARHPEFLGRWLDRIVLPRRELRHFTHGRR